MVAELNKKNILLIVAAVLGVALYYVIALIGKYATFPFHSHIPVIYSVGIDIIQVAIFYLLFKKKGTPYQHAFILLMISSTLKIILDIIISLHVFQLVSESQKQWFFTLGGPINVAEVLCQISAGIIFLKIGVIDKRKIIVKPTAIPLLCSFLLLFITFSLIYWWERTIGNIHTIYFITLILEFILFLINLIILSCTNKTELTLLFVGLSILITVNIFVDRSSWATLYSYLSIWSSLWIIAKIITIYASSQLLIKKYSISESAWFGSADSLRIQINLWCNGVVSLFLLLHIGYYSITQISFSLFINFFQSSLEVYLAFIVLCTILTRIFSRFIERPFQQIEATLSRNKSKQRLETLRIDIKEFRIMWNRLSDYFNKIKQKTETEKKLFDIASKSVHDMSSPLSTLEVIGKNAEKQLGERQTRIFSDTLYQLKHITKTLLDQYKNTINLNKEINDSYQFLSILIEEIISQKKIQYHDQVINIRWNPSNENRFFVFKLENVLFKRALSCLIDNALEASESKKDKQLTIQLSQTKNHAVISIKDYGCGMSEEQRHHILKGTGKTTKSKGYGIGLKNVISTVRNWKGFCDIKSEINKGTEFIIYLPKTSPPAWLFSTFQLNTRQRIVLLDHNPKDQKIFKKIFNQHRKLQQITIEFLSSIEEFYDSLTLDDNSFYFIDLNIKGCKTTGLDIIRECHLNQVSCLITDEFTQPNIQNQCALNKTFLLPRTLLKYISVD